MEFHIPHYVAAVVAVAAVRLVVGRNAAEARTGGSALGRLRPSPPTGPAWEWCRPPLAPRGGVPPPRLRRRRGRRQKLCSSMIKIQSGVRGERSDRRQAEGDGKNRRCTAEDAVRRVVKTAPLGVPDPCDRRPQDSVLAHPAARAHVFRSGGGGGHAQQPGRQRGRTEPRR